MTIPTPGPPRPYRGVLTVFRGVTEGLVWGTVAGALLSILVIIIVAGRLLLTYPLIALAYLPGVMVGATFGAVYGAITGVACGPGLHLGVVGHRKRRTPFSPSRQRLVGGFTGALAAGLTGLTLFGLQLDDPSTIVGTRFVALALFVIVPTVAAGATMALRAPAIVNAGYVTTPPTGRPISGPAPLVEPPAV